MDAFDFLRAKARMCRVHRDCAECPADGNCVTGINANSSNEQVEKAVAIVERWAKENPQETRWTLLKKQYPKLKDNAKFCICARDLGYECKDCALVDCDDCWDILVDEEEQEWLKLSNQVTKAKRNILCLNVRSAVANGGRVWAITK